MEGQIEVSVICNAYNHEKYIRDALDSFLMQKTNFGFEILIHDDASTDGTTNIIREYEEKYPDIIKPIYQENNQYSKGISIGYEFQYPRAKGKYIAICEGDDYWTSPDKLQKQYDILETHPQIDMCAHKTVCVDANTKKFISYTAPENQDCIIPVERVINAHGLRVVETSSLFYRISIARSVPEYVKVMTMDTTLRIKGALRGGIYYIDECMSAYRWLSDGSWTLKTNSKVAKEKLYQKRLKMLNTLDKETEGKYAQAIQNEITETDFWFVFNWGDCRSLRDNKYKKIIKTLSWKMKIKLLLRQLFPSINKSK